MIGSGNFVSKLNETSSMPSAVCLPGLEISKVIASFDRCANIYSLFSPEVLASQPELEEIIEEIKISEDVVTQLQLNSSTNTICYMLSPFLKHLFIRMSSSGNRNIPQVGFTEDGINMSLRIKYLLEFARMHAAMSTGEVIHSLIILNRLVNVEMNSVKEGHSSTIIEDSLGTLLLCTLLVSCKLSRDRSYKNAFWSKLFGIPVDVINQAEREILKKINYCLYVDEEEYWEWFHFLVHFEEASKVPRTLLL